MSSRGKRLLSQARGVQSDRPRTPGLALAEFWRPARDQRRGHANFTHFNRLAP